jgi:hypothetical protein
LLLSAAVVVHFRGTSELRVTYVFFGTVTHSQSTADFRRRVRGQRLGQANGSRSVLGWWLVARLFPGTLGEVPTSRRAEVLAAQDSRGQAQSTRGRSGKEKKGQRTNSGISRSHPCQREITSQPSRRGPCRRFASEMSPTLPCITGWRGKPRAVDRPGSYFGTWAEGQASPVLSHHQLPLPSMDGMGSSRRLQTSIKGESKAESRTPKSY